MKIRFLILVLALLLLALVACSPAGGAEPAVEVTPELVETAPPELSETPAVAPEIVDEAEAGDDAAALCPEPGEGTMLLQHEANGYCFLYPAGLDAVQTGENGVSIVEGSLLASSEHPRLGLEMEDAGGSTVEEIADQMVADYEGFELPRSSVTLGGVEAVVFDGVPGQDINRVVLAVYDGRLYRLRFSPASEDAGEAFARMEELYQVVVESFTFVPVVPGATLLAGPECPEPAEGTELLRNEEHGYCLLYPSDYSVEGPTENQTILYVGSLLDVEHPKLFIQVTDAAGRTAQEAEEEAVAEVQEAIPGIELERTFGLLLDGESANMVDNMPGQDLSRQLFAVHDGRLYKLTFVPSDEAAGEAYTEMEALYELILGSFNFLIEE